MKTIVAILCVLMLLAGLTGCEKAVDDQESAESGQEQQEQVSVPESQETTPVQPEQTEPVVPQLDQALEAEIEKVVCSGEKIYAPKSNLKKAIGDIQVFGLGVGNYMLDDQKFYFKVAAQAPKDYNFNTLVDANLKYIEQNWLSYNEYPQVTIKTHDCFVFPFTVEVKDMMAEGKPTLPGSYSFDVTVFYIDEKGFHNEYGEDVTFTVRV